MPGVDREEGEASDKILSCPREDPSPQTGGTDAQTLPWDNSLGAMERRKAILPVRTQNLGKQGARLPLARW